MDKNELVKQKHDLIRKYDQKEISEEEYNNQISSVNNSLNQVLEQETEDNKTKMEVNDKHIAEVKEKMDEEVKKNKRGRGPSSTSYTMLIINTLKMKSIRNINDTIEKVNEEKPGRDKERILAQTKSIINLVKKQKPERWTKYAWDADNFLLTEKEE